VCIKLLLLLKPKVLLLVGGRGGGKNVHIIGMLIKSFESGDEEYLMINIFKYKNCDLKVFRKICKNCNKY